MASTPLPSRVLLILLALACPSLTGCVLNKGITTEAASETAPAEPKTTNTEGDEAESSSIAATTEGMRKRIGFLTIFLDEEKGRILAELPSPIGPRSRCLSMLVNVGLRRGLGSNPVGLDRGQLSSAQLVEVRRLGPKVLFEIPNLRFRAPNGGEAEQRAAAESFATSVLWGTDAIVVDESGNSLIDLTDFLIRDGHGVVSTLRSTDQGSYQLDRGRSALELGETLVFPNNVECEATLTFTTSGRPGSEVWSTAPVAQAISLVQHVSFARLPDNKYVPRAFDPRTGTFSIGYRDYSAPLDDTIETRWATRHRLKEGDTITYYVDRGAPEPIRGALLDGARWWAEAFAAAGYPEGFKVELLPEHAHPLDLRYNVIQWVHRATRGWSYGNSIVDPRTGEIIKGHVSLGSLRVRQDRLLFEGLLGTEKTGTGAADDPIELSLARIRQLSAHEIGHTLGLAHNFAGSTQGRSSVMDYPPPRILVTDDGFDVSEAYGVGIGAWDIHAIRTLYTDFSDREVSEEEAIEQMIIEAREKGLFLLTDMDARSGGASDPRGSLWDDGETAEESLENAIAVRARGLENFGPDRLPAGEPRGRLEEVFAPVYFHHRFALDAAGKVIGGIEYEHALAGDEAATPKIIDAERQRAALQLLLRTLEEDFLAIPEETLAALAPPAPGNFGSRERFRGKTSPHFDPLTAAATCADMTLRVLLNETRLMRVATQTTRDPQQLSLEELLQALIETFEANDEKNRSPRQIELDRVVERAIVDALIDGAGSSSVAPPVRAAIDGALGELLARLGPLYEPRQLRIENGVRATILRDLTRHLARTPGERIGRVTPVEPPPGSPIGCGHCDELLLLRDAGRD